MSDINTITISGNLGKDMPELKGKNSDFVAVSLCSVNSYRPDGQEEWVDKKTWVDVVAFRGVATRLAKKFRPGDQITVTGRIELNEWENEAGEKRRKHRIVATEIVGPAQYRTADEVAAIDAKLGVTTEAASPEAEDVAEEVATATAAASDDIPF